MVTDANLIVKNLLNFYNFNNKIVISVGVGGGQLIEYGRTAKKVFAIECDEKAADQLNGKITTHGFKNFELIKNDFYKTSLKGDVLLFEFCLHEMKDAKEAILHAKKSAQDVVIVDHLPGEWSYYTVEDKMIMTSTVAIKDFVIKKQVKVEAIQFFKDYEEIFNKLKSQGDEAVKRIDKFKIEKNFTIPMPYWIVLI